MKMISSACAGVNRLAPAGWLRQQLTPTQPEESGLFIEERWISVQASVGLLIHTASGKANALGGPFTNRSGCAA
jgi:hypothetical protein